MPESLGARLRQRRERQQIALTTISERTKIKVSLLEGLERDDVSHWPEGIFRRAFIRAYAQAVGLDPADVLREFLALHPDSLDIDAAGLDAAPMNPDAERTRPPTRLRFLVGSAIGSLSKARESAANRDGSTRSNPVVEEPPVVEETAVVGEAAAVEEAVVTDVPAPPPPAPEPVSFDPDLSAAALLCTELSRADQSSDIAALLSDVARILGASGLIVWIWDPQVSGLRPELAHGYPDAVLAQLPTVARDADNATAAAFRSGEACLVDGSERSNGALAVPLMTPRGCGGVLAVEVRNGCERMASVRALVTIFGAQLARWIPAEQTAELSDRRLA
jgi:transcriptional regulator with XRE-family HTH domain